MHQPIRSIISIILRARFSYLFLTIIMLFTFRPLIESLKAVTAATNIFVWFIVVSCVWAVHEKRKRQWFVISMAATAILLDLLDFLLRSTVTLWASKIAMFAFLGYAVVSILPCQAERGYSRYAHGGGQRVHAYWHPVVLALLSYRDGASGIVQHCRHENRPVWISIFQFCDTDNHGLRGRPAVIGSGAIPGHTGADNGTTLHCHYRGTARESIYCRWQETMSQGVGVALYGLDFF